jgi:hypothetical protein
MQKQESTLIRRLRFNERRRRSGVRDLATQLAPRNVVAVVLERARVRLACDGRYVRCSRSHTIDPRSAVGRVENEARVNGNPSATIVDTNDRRTEIP